MASAKQVPAGKSRLGRGLSSLIKVSLPETPPVGADFSVEGTAAKSGNRPAAETTQGRHADDTVGTGEPFMVAVAEIRTNPHQPRKTFPEAALRELAESIKSNGVIQPLIVTGRAAAAGGGYELIAGERRLRASKLAGLTQVPCVVRKVDGLTQAQMALVENIQREDLNPLERAEGYRALLQQLGLTQAELAGRLGEERSTIANYLRVLELAEPVKQMLRDGRISLGHAKLLAGVADVLEQERLGKLILSQGLSVRNLEKALLNGVEGGVQAGGAAKQSQAGRDAHYVELEKSIARQLGMKVQVKASKGKGKGKVTLHYGSLDQFDQLMAKLGVNID